jgi:hypothetical protein
MGKNSKKSSSNQRNRWQYSSKPKPGNGAVASGEGKLSTLAKKAANMISGLGR